MRMFQVSDEYDFDEEPFSEFNDEGFPQISSKDVKRRDIVENGKIPSSVSALEQKRLGSAPSINTGPFEEVSSKEAALPWLREMNRHQSPKHGSTRIVNNSPLEIIGKSSRQRKFPGPAGLLPLRNTSLIAPEEFQCELRKEESSSFQETEILSQGSSSAFEIGAWSAMLEYLGTSGLALLKKMNLNSVKSVGRHLRSYKVPFLAVLVQSIDAQLPDAAVVFKDPTGEMPGVIHREVWEQFGIDIVVGSVLVLRNVGIINAGSTNRKHVINITGNNLAAIFSSQDELNFQLRKIEVSTKASSPSCSALLDEWEKVESQSKIQASPQITTCPIPNLFPCHGDSANESPKFIHSSFVQKAPQPSNYNSMTPSRLSAPFSLMPNHKDRPTVRTASSPTTLNTSSPVGNQVSCFTMKNPTKRKFSPQVRQGPNCPSIQTDSRGSGSTATSTSFNDQSGSSSKKMKTDDNRTKPSCSAERKSLFEISCDDSIDSLLQGVDTDSLFNDF